MPGPWRTKLPNRGLVKIYALVFINMVSGHLSCVIDTLLARQGREGGRIG